MFDGNALAGACLPSRPAVCCAAMDTSQLHAALSAIVTPSASSGMTMGEAIRALDSMLQSTGGTLDPQLRHYLERRSYQKALAYLNDSSIPHQP